MNELYITVKDTNSVMLNTELPTQITALIKKGVVLKKVADNNIFKVQDKRTAWKYSVSPNDVELFDNNKHKVICNLFNKTKK